MAQSQVSVFDILGTKITSSTRLKRNITEKGFFYHTDPKRPGAAESDIINEPKQAVARSEKASVADNIVSTVLDTPVAISAKAGELMGETAQWTSDRIDQGLDKINRFGKDTIDDIKSSALFTKATDGLKTLDNYRQVGEERLLKIAASPWIGKIFAYPTVALTYPVKAMMPDSWDKLVNQITIHLTRDLLTQIAQVLIDWYKDPKTLCCLIKNLAALGSAMKEGTSFRDEQAKIFMGMNARDYLGSDYFKTVNILKKIRDFLDIIIEILSTDFFQGLFDKFDIGKEISDMLIGIMIATMEAMIAAGQESFYNKIHEWFKDMNQLDLQCLPLQKLLDVLERFLADDHGLFNLVRRYINEYARYLKWRFINNFNEKYINKARDLQFIRFLRDLIDKILKALENFEMCIEADYTYIETTNPLSSFNAKVRQCRYGVSADTTNSWVDCPYRTNTNNNILCLVNDQVPNQGSSSYCLHPDAISNYFNPQNYGPSKNIGNINDRLPGVGNTKIGDRKVGIVFPTDNEVRNFLVNRMGYSKDQADQMVAESQTSSQEGKVELDLSKYNFGGNTQNPDGTVNIDNDLANKRKQLISALGDCSKNLSAQTIADLATKLTDLF